MVRKTVGDFMGMGWNVFRPEPGTSSITAGSLVKGLEQLMVEIRKFIKEPMEAYLKVRLSVLCCISPLEEYISLTFSLTGQWETHRWANPHGHYIHI